MGVIMTIWRQKIYLGDLFNNNLPFEERRDRIVERMKEVDGNKYLDVILEDLANSGSSEEFDSLWDEVYDWADINKVWIDTWN